MDTYFPPFFLYLKSNCLNQYHIIYCCESSSCSVTSDSWQPHDCSLLGSSVHGIFPARILEWVVISSSRESSGPRGWTCVSCIGRYILNHWTAREDPHRLSFHFVGFFAVQNLLSLIRSHLFVFAFISFTLGDRSKKILLRYMSENVFLSSGSFMVFLCVFKPFWVYFCMLCERVFWFHWFTCSCPAVPAPLAEETVFSPLYILASFVKD